MTIRNLKDLYIHELQDLFSANTQSSDIHKTLLERCTNAEAKQKMTRVIDGINDGLDAVRTIGADHGFALEGERCKGMAGLVTEAKAHAADADIDDEIVRDASIISQSSRMEHYALAGYESCLTYARALGLNDDVRVLEKCVEGTRSSGQALRAVVIESAKLVTN